MTGGDDDPVAAIAWSCDPDGVGDLISDLRQDIYPDVVAVYNFAGLGDDVGLIRDFIADVIGAGASLHVVGPDVRIDPDSDVADAVRGVLDGIDSLGVELQRAAAARDVRRWLGGDASWQGRPPLGFDVDGGELVPGEDFDEIRAALVAVDREEMTKYRAAKELGCAERTIGRALDERRGMYGLDE